MAIFCTCCKSEITAPQFHKGNPYGYTCIKRVAPQYRRDADPGLWDVCEIEAFVEDNRVMGRIHYKGRTHKQVLRCMASKVHGLDFDKAWHDAVAGIPHRVPGFVKMAKHKDGKLPLWKDAWMELYGKE